MTAMTEQTVRVGRTEKNSLTMQVVFGAAYAKVAGTKRTVSPRAGNVESTVVRERKIKRAQRVKTLNCESLRVRKHRV